MIPCLRRNGKRAKQPKTGPAYLTPDPFPDKPASREGRGEGVPVPSLCLFPRGFCSKEGTREFEPTSPLPCDRRARIREGAGGQVNRGKVIAPATASRCTA